MKAMSQYTRMEPAMRVRKLMDFNSRLNRSPESLAVLKEWNFELERDLVSLNGRVLRNEKIVFANRIK